MAVNENKVMTLKDTANLIAKVHKAAANPVAIAPHYDGAKGEYDNLAEWWSLNRDGKVYGVKIPTADYSNDPTGIKIRDNIGLVCEPSTNTIAGRDDYAKLNAFKVVFCNGTIDSEGVFHCTAIEGDTMFKRDGSNGDVWVMVCAGYYSITREGGYKVILYSDSPQAGFKPLPGVKYPDGTLRPALVFSPYAAWCDSSNVPHAYSGKHRTYQFGSHDNGVAYAKKKGSGYSGMTIAELFYLELMFMLKYATQNSQKLGGCSDYWTQYKVAAGETNAKRVVVSKSTADYFVVGSTLNCGTSNDRGQDASHSVFENRVITKIEQIAGSENWAIYVDGEAFTTTTDDYIMAMPWVAGSCDKILGIDGYPVSGKPTSKQPYRIQGIECFIGTYEVLTDIIVNQVKDSDSAGRCELHKCFDARKYSSSLDASHVKLDVELPARITATNGNWQYSTDWVESTKCPGFLVNQGVGGTSTTGLCDGVYSDPISSPGLRELLCFGNLGNGSFDGVFCRNSSSGLGWFYWNCAGRLSGLGVTMA